MINHDGQTVRQPGLLYCWMCGRSKGKKPSDWAAPFTLDMMHIASGGGDAVRVDDRRAVILGCSRCHKLHVSNSEKLPTMNLYGVDYPTIDARHSLYAKFKFDHGFYDRDFLQKYWIGVLPQPEKPPVFFLDELAKNVGIIFV